MSKQVITLCLYPFPAGTKWVVCETEIDNSGNDSPTTFESVENTALQQFEPNDKEEALSYARYIAKVRDLELLVSDSCPIRPD